MNKTPQRYNHTKMSHTEFQIKNNFDFYTGNIAKYIYRHRYKAGIDDLKKASNYIDIIKENNLYDAIHANGYSFTNEPNLTDFELNTLNSLSAVGYDKQNVLNKIKEDIANEIERLLETTK